MKTDREFLEGVYEKVSHMRRQPDLPQEAPLPENKPKRAFWVMLGTSSAAAVIALIGIPVFLIGSNQSAPLVEPTPKPALFSASETQGGGNQTRSHSVDLLFERADAVVKVEAGHVSENVFQVTKVWKAPEGWSLEQVPASLEQVMDGCSAALLFCGTWEGKQVLLDVYRQIDPANPQRYENVDGDWIEEQDLE